MSELNLTELGGHFATLETKLAELDTDASRQETPARCLFTRYAAERQDSFGLR